MADIVESLMDNKQEDTMLKQILSITLVAAMVAMITMPAAAENMAAASAWKLVTIEDDLGDGIRDKFMESPEVTPKSPLAFPSDGGVGSLQIRCIADPKSKGGFSGAFSLFSTPQKEEVKEEDKTLVEVTFYHSKKLILDARGVGAYGGSPYVVSGRYRVGTDKAVPYWSTLPDPSTPISRHVEIWKGKFDDAVDGKDFYPTDLLEGLARGDEITIEVVLQDGRGVFKIPATGAKDEFVKHPCTKRFVN